MENRTGRNRLWDHEAEELLRVIVKLENVQDARRFLRDLMTRDEIHMVVDRWRVARMLHEGLSYRTIEERTGLSSRTIARISHSLKEGEGGYRSMLGKLE